jgi:hypothetical protein
MRIEVAGKSKPIVIAYMATEYRSLEDQVRQTHINSTISVNTTSTQDE